MMGRMDVEWDGSWLCYDCPLTGHILGLLQKWYKSGFGTPQKVCYKSGQKMVWAFPDGSPKDGVRMVSKW